jgi:hypothetical protein
MALVQHRKEITLLPTLGKILILHPKRW